MPIRVSFLLPARRPRAALLGAVLWLWAHASAAAPLAVQDAGGHTVRLDAPATRVISLAPHTTELLFAVGAGARVIGTVSYSDWPPAANDIPRVGSYDSLDLERIVALRPELVVGWKSGNPGHQIERLRALGVPVYLVEPRRLEDISAAMRVLGSLVEGARDARAAAQAFDDRLAALRAAHADAPRLRVFYQLWDRPLMTIGGEQIISQALRVCGGDNVFAHLDALAAQVSVEAVLAADPQVIVSAGMGESAGQWLEAWRRWPFLHAVREDNLLHVAPDLMHRASPRLLEGVSLLCAQLARTRAE